MTGWAHPTSPADTGNPAGPTTDPDRVRNLGMTHAGVNPGPWQRANMTRPAAPIPGWRFRGLPPDVPGWHRLTPEPISC